MEPRLAEHRDPGAAAVLSAIVPGAGLLYAGSPRAGAVILFAEVVLFALGWWVALLPLHAWQIVAAAGTAGIRGERQRDVFETRRAANLVGSE